MASITRKQDLPPQGGYKPIPFMRNPARTYFTGFQMFAGYVGITTAGLYLYYLNYLDVKRDDIEMRSARHALQPLLFAERDREYLKQIRKNRDEEERLMANVPNWKVGTWYGEPIFKTLPNGTWVDPSYAEFYSHASTKYADLRADLKLWT